MAWFFKSTKEALDRRAYYLGQLRRHENASRNRRIATYWNSIVTAEMKAGRKQRAAFKSANEATGKNFGLSASQIRRVRQDTGYLMSAESLKHRRRELSLLKRDLEHANLVSNRIARFEFHVAAGIKAGHSPAEAFTGAISATAHELGKHPGTIRRNLVDFGIRRPIPR